MVQNQLRSLYLLIFAFLVIFLKEQVLFLIPSETYLSFFYTNNQKNSTKKGILIVVIEYLNSQENVNGGKFIQNLNNL